MTLSVSGISCSPVPAIAELGLGAGWVVFAMRDMRLACHDMYITCSRATKTTTPTTMSPIDVPLNLFLSEQFAEETGDDPAASLLRAPRLKTLRS